MKYRDVLATALVMMLAVAGAAGAKEGSGPARVDASLPEQCARHRRLRFLQCGQHREKPAISSRL